MDITEFFKKKSKADRAREREWNKSKDIEKELKNKYLGLLGNIVNNGWIDMLEYTHMVNFYKSGGTLVGMGRFEQIMNKIASNTEINSSTKGRFLLVCKKLFSHLYSLIDNSEGGELNIQTVLEGISQHNEESIEFTRDQKRGIKSICEFLYKPSVKTYGLYGYAGTGKTTLITKLIHYLLLKNYVNSVVFAAPTNKAVNIMKSKFKNDIDLLMKEKLYDSSSGSESLNQQLDKLEEQGFKINFLTIHKLLNYKNDFSIDGERVFVKGKKSSISNYDLVIIDECSMIPFQVVAHIFEDLNDRVKFVGEDQSEEIVRKVPKVLFVGDPAQLPPVNEKVSMIFSKDKSDFDLELFEKTVCSDQEQGFFDRKGSESIKSRMEALQEDIFGQGSTTLEKVVRSSNNKVVGLCNDVRGWVIGLTEQPKIGVFKGKKVKIYRHSRKIKKTNSKWFKTAVQYFKSKDASKLSNIILVWTNKQCDRYNFEVRKNIFGSKKLNKYEIGDILILNDFYNIKETEVVNQKDNQKRFYTSEQIKVVDIDEVIKVSPALNPNLSNRVKKLKYFNIIDDKFKKVINSINKNTLRKYNVYKLLVQKLNEVAISEDEEEPETYQIYVVKEDSKRLLEEERDFASNQIRELRKHYRIYHKDQIATIDKEIIKPLWREWNIRFSEPFANVNVAFSTSVHKSQGSSFYNVFVDADNILKNRNYNEAKRCIYTALTRTSNELHILI